LDQQLSQNSDGFVADQNGEKYFIFGNTRVKVVEHFAEQEKTLSQLLVELVLQQAKRLEENPSDSIKHRN